MGDYFENLKVVLQGGGSDQARYHNSLCPICNGSDTDEEETEEEQEVLTEQEEVIGMDWDDKARKIRELAEGLGCFCKEEKFSDGGKRIIIREKRKEDKDGRE